MFLTKLFSKKKKKVVKKEKRKGTRHLKKLSKYIKKMLKKGFSEKKIENMLLASGWSKRIVNGEMLKIRNIHNQNNKMVKKPKPIIGKKPLAQRKISFKPKTLITQILKPKTLNLAFSNQEIRGDIMTKKISQEEANHFLREVDSENCFWINNGEILNSLEAFSGVLEEMEEDKFNYHVNKEKNDFANWVGDVIEDKTLAKNISKSKTKETFLKKLDTRITYLKKIAS